MQRSDREEVENLQGGGKKEKKKKKKKKDKDGCGWMYEVKNEFLFYIRLFSYTKGRFSV